MLPWNSFDPKNVFIVDFCCHKPVSKCALSVVGDSLKAQQADPLTAASDLSVDLFPRCSALIHADLTLCAICIAGAPMNMPQQLNYNLVTGVSNVQ